MGAVLLVAACGGGSSPAGALTIHQKALEYAQCMRNHGEPGWPDPPGRQTGINLASPQYRRANADCKDLQPREGQLTAAQQKQALSQNLKFAACMRSHGIANYPDPTVPKGGGITFTLPNSVDKGSPQFQAAQKDCQRALNG